MEQIIGSTQKIKGRMFGMDGATNIISKSVCNVMININYCIFIECFSYLKRKTTINGVVMVEDVIKRLFTVTGTLILYSFISVSSDGIRDVRKNYWV